MDAAHLHPSAARRAESALAIEVGARFLESRRIADMDSAEAAKALGLEDVNALESIERGRCVPLLAQAIAAARVYGTTLDFLCGSTEDGDRDPACAVHRYLAARVSADFQRLIRATADLNVRVARLHPTAAQGRRLAREVIEAGRALTTFRALNPSFDTDTRGGASVVNRLGRAVASASAYQAKLERAKRRTTARTVDASDDEHLTCSPEAVANFEMLAVLGVDAPG